MSNIKRFLSHIEEENRKSSMEEYEYFHNLYKKLYEKYSTEEVLEYFTPLMEGENDE